MGVSRGVLVVAALCGLPSLAIGGAPVAFVLDEPGWFDVAFDLPAGSHSIVARLRNPSQLAQAHLLVYGEDPEPVMGASMGFSAHAPGVYVDIETPSGERLRRGGWRTDDAVGGVLSMTVTGQFDDGAYRAIGYGAGRAASWEFELPPETHLKSYRGGLGRTFVFHSPDFRDGPVTVAISQAVVAATAREGAHADVSADGTLLAGFYRVGQIDSPTHRMSLVGPAEARACPCHAYSTHGPQSLPPGEYAFTLSEIGGELRGRYRAHGLFLPS